MPNRVTSLFAGAPDDLDVAGVIAAATAALGDLFVEAVDQVDELGQVLLRSSEKVPPFRVRGIRHDEVKAAVSRLASRPVPVKETPGKEGMIYIVSVGVRRKLDRSAGEKAGEETAS